MYRPSDKLADTYAGCELDFPAAIPTQRATTILRCVMTKNRYLQKYGYFPLYLCHTHSRDVENFTTIGRSSIRVTDLARQSWTLTE